MFISHSSRRFAAKENVPDNASELTPFIIEDVTKESGATYQNSNNNSSNLRIIKNSNINKF